MDDAADGKRIKLEKAAAMINPLVCAGLWNDIIATQHAMKHVWGEDAAELAETYALRWVTWYLFLLGYELPKELNKLTEYIP